MNELSPIELLTRQHDRTRFNCGNPELDHWLQAYARQAQDANSARTFVVHRDMRVVGYYSLAMASVEREVPPPELTKKLPRYPVGAALLARLAVDVTEAKRGLGAELLRDSMERSVQAVDIFAAPVFMVRAIDDAAAEFYKHFGFVPAESDDRMLFLSINAIRESIREAAR